MIKQILDCVGNTPLIEIPGAFFSANSSVLVKLEEYNHGGSIKARVGCQMILDAEESGVIDSSNPESVTIVEPTGGNTGIGIAQICALRKYRCILVVPDNYSKKRVQILKKLGAEIVLSDSATGNDSHIVEATRIAKAHPSYFMPDQFSNPSNPKAHYTHTGPEIIREVEGKVDYFVAGVGTGGTLTGTGRALKEAYPSCKVYAVQPKGCDVLNGLAIPHIIQGIAIGQIPKVLDRSIVSGVIDVTENEVQKTREALSKELGLYLGFSAAANIFAAGTIARREAEKTTIVTVAPDGGRNYDD